MGTTTAASPWAMGAAVGLGSYDVATTVFTIVTNPVSSQAGKAG